MTQFSRAIPLTLLTLPAELRVHILSYVLTQPLNPGFTTISKQAEAEGKREPIEYSGLVWDRTYSHSQNLTILIVCRQIWHEMSALAFRSTTFFINTPKDWDRPLATLTQPLQEWQIQNIRKIVLYVNQQRYNEMNTWTRYPLDNPNLRLAELSMCLHVRFRWVAKILTSSAVQLLLRLENVEKFKYVFNDNCRKISFREWYVRLQGGLLKESHLQRYGTSEVSNRETTWWAWRFDEGEYSIEFEAVEPLPLMPEHEYTDRTRPLLEQYRRDLEKVKSDGALMDCLKGPYLA